jgi:predicted DNA-binding transcriptional regulator AlpA
MSALTILRTINKEVFYLSKELFVRAEEVAGALGISKPYAYKLVREMNEELKQKGFLTIPGRVSRRYFEEKFYGLRENQ